MWKAVYGSVQGTMHVEDGTPCQDACGVNVLPQGDSSFLICVCSDGAGSAIHAHEGSRLTCDTFLELAQTEVISNSHQDWIARDWAVSICKQIRDRLVRKAEELGCPLREVSCTLVAAIIGENGSAFIQIGDGAMAVTCNGEMRVVFWPQSGEYINTTNFLTDVDFEDKVCHRFSFSQVNELAAFTDGLERLALRFGDRSVYSPFLEPMLQAMRNTDDVDQFFDPLRNFLGSPQVNDRTNDDKTLILASRF